MYDFLTDLDEYFCESYANYSQLCVLEGYKMPVMQATKTDEYGRTYAYTLPADTMRLSLQEKKSELLAALKSKLTDLTFSFSFHPLPFFKRWSNRFSKKGFVKNFKEFLRRYSTTAEQVGNSLAVSGEIWKKICKGSFFPSKNLLFSIALVAQSSVEDCELLLAVCNEGFDFSMQKDVVVYYLLRNKVFNEGMAQAALSEYKIRNLFLKTDE